MASIAKRTYEKKDGTRTVRWRARIYLGEDDAGRQQKASKTFSSKEEAEAWAEEQEQKRERERRADADPGRETLARFGLRWLEDVKRGEVATGTWEEYRAIWRRYVEEPVPGAPKFGSRRLEDLQPKHVREAYLFLLRDRGLARSTVKRLHAVVRQVLDHADAVRATDRHPLPRRFKVPRLRSSEEVGLDSEVPEDGFEDDVPEGRRKAMSREEHERWSGARCELLGEAARRTQWVRWPYVLFGLLEATGLRPSEALALGWKHLDLPERGPGEVRVRRSLSRTSGNGPVLKPPKSENGIRDVPLASQVVAELREHRKRQRERELAAEEWGNPWDLVFTTGTGKPVDLTNLRRYFIKVSKRAGLGTWGERPEKPAGQPGPRRQRPFEPSYSPYVLRHTWITRMIDEGVPVAVVSKLAGHHSVAFTIDRYVGKLEHLTEQAGVVVERVYGGEA